MDEFDFDAAYRVTGYRGIAWHAISYKKEHDFVPVFEEDGEYTGHVDYEEFEDKTKVVCVMVGDDREFTFYTDELTKLDEGDYCPSCGQIGCTAGGL